MRIATWNINSLNVRLGRLEEWIGYAQPDVLCLQETKIADAAFPTMAISALGYESIHVGDGRWNGVAILSRVGLTDIIPGFPDAEAPFTEPRLVSAMCGGVRIWNVYVPNGRGLDDPHYQFKLAWFEKFTELVMKTSAPTEAVALMGDFNVAPKDIDVHNPTKFIGSTHVSEPERAAIKELESLGFVDVFREHHPEEKLFTFWDYRAGDFHMGRGMRIDLALLSEPIANKVTFALVDRQARKGEKPSDHAPMIIDIDI